MLHQRQVVISLTCSRGVGERYGILTTTVNCFPQETQCNDRLLASALQIRELEDALMAQKATVQTLQQQLAEKDQQLQRAMPENSVPSQQLQQQAGGAQPAAGLQIAGDMLGRVALLEQQLEAAKESEVR